MRNYSIEDFFQKWLYSAGLLCRFALRNDVVTVDIDKRNLSLSPNTFEQNNMLPSLRGTKQSSTKIYLNQFVKIYLVVE